MGSMPWFGGLITNKRETPQRPSGSRLTAPLRCPIWTVGSWLGSEVRMATAGHRQVTIFGPCSATDHDVHRLAERGVTNTVLLAFAGSYTVVESIPDCTIVFTDLSHTWPIYTVTTMRGLVWGSSALALAAISGARPDPSWLAAALLAPQAPELTAGRSAFADVSVVPPASRLVMRPGVRPQVRSGWQLETTVVEVKEGAARLRRALGDAVLTRIATSCSPSADCSGGLDSTSLALLASDQLPGGERLHAVTVHPVSTTTGGDLDYARIAVRASSNLTHLLCPLENRHAPFSRMQELMPPTDEPAPTTIAIARAVAEFDMLREVGSDCHLTGDGGDTLLGGHPAYLADLVRWRQARLLAHHVIGWARLRRITVWPVLAEALRTAITSRAASLIELASELSDGGRRRQRGPAFAKWPQRSSTAVWATPLAREIAAELACSAAARAWYPRDAGIGATLTLQAIQTVGRTARADLQVARYYGVRLHNPFTDPQVIAACLSVPTWQRQTPYQYKPLLTTALIDLLPAEIAARRTKGDFTPDHYLGVRINASALYELADGHLAALDLIHPARLRQLLAQVEAGLPVISSEFEPVLAAEVWLRRVADAMQSALWEPCATSVEVAS